MSTFTTLTSASGSLIVDRAPIITERFGDRGKQSYVTKAITGVVYVVESTSTPPNSELNILFTKLTAAQAETLASILDGGGVITAKLKVGGSTFPAAYGGVHSIEAIVGDYPDGDRAAGAALDTQLTKQSASVTLYRLT